MKFGYGLFGSGSPKFVNRDYLVSLTQRAEALGFDSIWIGDRIIEPLELRSLHPLIPGGRLALGGDPEDNAIDPLIGLAFLGGLTQKIRLGTSVLVLPNRHPLLMAKMVTVLDYLTEGRVILGVSTGWMEEEFQVLDTPPFAERGAVTDEVIQFFKAVCTQDMPAFHGKFFGLSGVTVYPKPVQRPHPPIWIGGHSRAALRRAAVLGDGWHPTGISAEEVARGKAVIDEVCQGVGRDPAAVEIGIKCNVDLRESAIRQDGRAPFSGSLEQLREDVYRFQEAGATYLSFRPAVGTPAVEQLDETYRYLELLARLKDEFE